MVDAARSLLVQAIARRVFPAAVVDVGSSRGPLWREAAGTPTFDVDSPAADEHTPFDLASLTKVVATTTVIMELVRSQAMRLEDLISDGFEDWRSDDRARVSVRDVLEHASGLAARLMDPPPPTAREFAHDIAVMPLEYPPRSRSLYSDLGFILLGLLASDRGRRPLAVQFDDIRDRLALDDPVLAREPLTYAARLADKQHAAPTWPVDDDARRGRMLVGEVHDHYAAILGEVAGHAGVFGTAGSVAAFARVVLRAARGDPRVPEPFTPSLVARFVTKSTVPGSSRALGWDTMLATSSCGTKMSASAFGHVGFTGTSLWIDPARDRYYVLLTNRTFHGGSMEEMRDVRRSFHDALSEL